ncbi:hypothetical protein ACOI22_03325 [Glaciecola sp. 2405UD65-10]|uniref:hypothetical protein n=1 Tax=Glaciecola sp. 2405UD65-10 TaxID=3397244 RepID=UPI003B5B60A3
MKNYGSSIIAQLRQRPTITYLIEMEVGATTYYFTTSDTNDTYNGNTYIAGVVDDESIEDIEITSTPKTDDSNISLHSPSATLKALFLNENYMNKPIKTLKHITNYFGDEIVTKTVFEGLISSVDINAEDNLIEITQSSIWADYERVTGIKTNTTSQQRHYPTDTAFDHASNAIDKVYWGQESPVTESTGTGGGGGSSFSGPSVLMQ